MKEYKFINYYNAYDVGILFYDGNVYTLSLNEAEEEMKKIQNISAYIELTNRSYEIHSTL